MLRNAPKFYEVAKRIVEITEDCILVAHNADFDYRILKTEFSRLGFNYKRKSLCTVELSRQLLPDMDSYSLGKLARALGIPVSDRHRANGDALATLQLFKLLLAKDQKKCIVKEAVKVDRVKRLKPNLKQLLEDLPNETGVYYIHNEDGHIIYIGKSNNIKKRVNQHFTKSNSKSKQIQRQVANVTFEKTGSELVALLKESEEIKKNKPPLNRALKQHKFSHGLYIHKNEDGYIELKVKQITKNSHPITTFTNRQSGISFMNRMVEELDLCPKLCHLQRTNNSCFNYDIDACHGACLNKEPASQYNERVRQLIDKYSYEQKDLVLIDRGRFIDERSAILIEDGTFKGIGYVQLNHQITHKHIIKSVITPMTNNRDTQHIIQSYMRRQKFMKIIKF